MKCKVVTIELLGIRGESYFGHPLLRRCLSSGAEESFHSLVSACDVMRCNEIDSSEEVEILRRV